MHSVQKSARNMEAMSEAMFENVLFTRVSEAISSKEYEIVRLMPDPDGVEKITVSAVEKNFSAALSFCRCTQFGKKCRP